MPLFFARDRHICSARNGRSRLSFAGSAIVLISVGVALLELTASTASAQQTEPCKLSAGWLRCDDALQASTMDTDPAQRWHDDSDYWLTDLTGPADPRKRLNVTGDQVNLSAIDFVNFVRQANDSRLDIAELVVDARAIVVDMPLRIDSFNLKLRAETVTFTKRGEIALLDPPSIDDGLSIVARVLDFRDTKRRPFNFTTTKSGWTFTRTIKITAASLLTQGPVTDYIEYFRQRTKDPLTTGTSTASYTIDVNSQTAFTAYANSLEREVLWPTAFSGKLARQFAYAPYSSKNRAFLSALADGYAPTFIPERFAYALSLISRVRTAIRTETDLAGRSIYFVPRQDYFDLLQYFDRANEDSFAVLQLWTEVIADTMTGNASAKRAELRSQIRLSVDAIAAQIRTRQVEAADLEATVASTNQELQNLEAKLVAEQARLEACIDRQKDAQAKKQQLGAATQLVALAGTAAAAVFCPAAAPYVAGALSLAQAMVVKGSVTNVNDVVEVALKAKAASEQYQAMSKQLIDSARAVSEAVKSGQYDGLDKKLSASTTKLSAIIDWVKTLQSPALDPNEVTRLVAEGCDTSTILTYKNLFAATQNKLGELQSELVKLSQSVILLGADADVAYKKLLELNIESVTNDRERVATQTLGMAVWDDVFSQLATVAPDVMRAFAYYSGEEVFSSTPMAQMLAVYLDRSRSLRELRSQLKRGEDSIDAQYLLTATKERHRLFKTQVLTLRSKERDVLARQFSPAIVKREFRGKAGRTVDESRFLFALNADIRRQVGELAAGSNTTRSGMIELPTTMFPASAVAGTWSQLDYASVTGVKWRRRKSLEALAIELAVVHPAYGNVCNQRKCYFVDFSDANADSNTVSYASSIGASGDILEPTRPLALYARPPVSTQYYLQIRVARRGTLGKSAQAVPQAPELKDLTLSMWAQERR